MAIPKIIHQFWTGAPMPTLYRIYVNELIEMHPTWEHRLWKMDELAKQQNNFYNWPLVEAAEKVSPKAPQQLISDILRYEILHQYGGVWLDVDMDPNKPIDPLCVETEGWACWEEPGKWVNNAALASAPRSAWLKEIILGLADNIDRNPDAVNSIKSGPQYITPIVLKHGVTVYPKEYFYPYLWNELHREVEAFPDSYAIHRWNNRRRRLPGRAT